MQSEEFDNKIREAADHHHPAYDEKAWINMEKLLDKHLPQEKNDRRRIIFFLLFFLLLGSGVWLFISRPWKENKQLAEAKQTVEQPAIVVTSGAPTADKDNNITKPAIDIPDNKTDDKKSLVPDISIPRQDNNSIPGNASVKKEQRTATAIITAPVNKKTYRNQTVSAIDDKTRQDDNEVKSSGQDKNNITPVKTNTVNLIAENNPSNKKNEPATGSDNPATATSTIQQVNEPKKETVNKENTIPVQDPVAKKTKPVIKKGNSFFLTLSAGPDISAAGTRNPGKIKLLAGAGLGYTFKDRVTIRTGFYTSRKVYTASPGEYHPPADFWRYYPYLEKVNADCKVYEIPLSLSYDFGNSSNHNWFASAGLSSYLMKKETYDYFYKYSPTSQTITSKWSLQDENKHYFSVLTLSAGYQRNIGKTTSLLIEPYFKMPLGGVGYGKVKLNSAGLLFTVGIKPFTILKGRSKLQH